MSGCIGVDGLTCVDGWLYSQVNMMIFPANRRCDACNKEEEVPMSEEKSEYVGRASYVKTLCVDFDGVIHSYVSGWHGADIVSDPVLPGAIRWLIELCDDPEYEVAIYSTRSRDPEGIIAMQDWLRLSGLPEGYLEQLKFPTQKPSPYLTIDDRAICFRGTYPSLMELGNFTPWNEGLKHANLNEKTEDSPKDATYENRVELADGLGWEDIAVTFMQNMELDGYDVEVADNDGVIVKTHVHLFEWSGDVTTYINEQDAMGLINYLVGLNTTTEGMRDGTTIR